MIKRLNEMTAEEAFERKCLRGRVPFVNYETNKTEYEYAVFFSFSIIFMIVSLQRRMVV
jgi:hypothetical protein